MVWVEIEIDILTIYMTEVFAVMVARIVLVDTDMDMDDPLALLGMI